MKNMKWRILITRAVCFSCEFETFKLDRLVRVEEDEETVRLRGDWTGFCVATPQPNHRRQRSWTVEYRHEIIIAYGVNIQLIKCDLQNIY